MGDLSSMQSHCIEKAKSFNSTDDKEDTLSDYGHVVIQMQSPQTGFDCEDVVPIMFYDTSKKALKVDTFF